MKTLHSKISRLTLALTLVLIFIGTTNQIKAQFTTPVFQIRNNSPCNVIVFFEFKQTCFGPFYCCLGGYTVNVPSGATVPVSVVPNDDALMRVFPNSYCPTCYYIGDFSTHLFGQCFMPSINAGTPTLGDDCNGNPNALQVVVNPTPCNCMVIN